VRSILQNNTAMECDGARRQQWQPNQRSYAHNSCTPIPALDLMLAKRGKLVESWQTSLNFHAILVFLLFISHQLFLLAEIQV